MLKMIFCGDSITANYGLLDIKDGYPYRVAQAFGYSDTDWKNTAISGYTSLDIKNNLNSLILTHNPKHAMIMVGTNDCRVAALIGEHPLDTVNNYITNIKYIELQLKALNIEVTFLSPISSRVLGEQYRCKMLAEALQNFCIDSGANFIDINAAFLYYINQRTQTETNAWFSDVHHPNPTGHYILAYQIIKTQVTL